MFLRKKFRILCSLLSIALIVGILPVSAFAAPAPKTNDSVIISDTIPSEMEAGKTYNVTITVKNTGSATWTNASGYKLNAIGDDPFSSTLSYLLSSKEKINKNKTKTFTISMTAPSTAGTYTTDWCMYKGETAFGETFTQTVTVVPLAPAYASTEALAHSAITVANETSEAAAKALLDTTVGVVGTHGETGVATISWTIASYDGSAAGDYMATGVLTLPAGWTGTAGNVTATVAVLGPAAYASKGDLAHSAITVPYGTSEADAIAALDSTVGVFGTNCETGDATISWTIASYDGSAAGDYTATGVLTLPAGWTGTAEDVTATVTVEGAPGVLPATSNWTMDIGIASPAIPYTMVMNVNGSTISGTLTQVGSELFPSTFTGTLAGQTFTGTWVPYRMEGYAGAIELTFNAPFDRLTGNLWLANSTIDPKAIYGGPITNGRLVP